MVIADLEAGIGTLTRLQEGQIDRVIVVSEPSVKSVQAASRAIDQADRVGAHVLIVANRIKSEDDRKYLEDAFPQRHMVVVPDDETIMDADRLGRAPVDHSPEGLGVQAIGVVATALVGEESK